MCIRDIYCALIDRCCKLAHTLNSLVRVSRRVGHTYGSTCIQCLTIAHASSKCFRTTYPLAAHEHTSRRKCILRTIMHVSTCVRQACACLHYTCVRMLDRTDCRTCGKMHCRSQEFATYQNQLWLGNGPKTDNRSNLTSSTLDVHRIAPNSHSYNYIFKVLFKTPSGYLFSIGFGHISIFR